MKIRYALLGGLLCAPLFGHAAEGLSYSYLEVDYIIQDIDAFEDDDLFDNFVDDFDDGDGFGIRGSFAFSPNWFVFGEYTETDADFTFVNDQGLLIPSDQDVERLSVGFGLVFPMAETVDLVGRAAYTDVDFGDFDLGGNSGDDFEFSDLDEDNSDGFFIDARLRAQLLEWLEGSAGARYTDIDSGDDFAFVGNLLFEFTQNWGVNLEVEVADEVSTYALGARYSF